MKGAPTVHFSEHTPARLVLIGVLVIAAIMRIHAIGERSLWLDEAKTALYSQGTFAEVVRETRMNSSAPLAHPALLWVVERYLGTAPEILRGISALFSLAALVVCVGADWKRSPLAACSVGLVLALSITQTRYAQEVREYSMALFIAAALYVTFERVVFDEHRRFSAVLFPCLCAVAAFVQYGLAIYTAALLSSGLLFWLWQGRKKALLVSMLTGGVALALASLGTYFASLRFQLGVIALQEERGKLATSTDGAGSLLRMIGENGAEFAGFLINPYLVGCLGMGLLIYFLAARNPLSRELIPLDIAIAVLVIGVGYHVVTSLLGLYPFGGIRQNIYFAPLLALVLGRTFDFTIRRIAGDRRGLLLAAYAGFFVFVWIAAAQTYFGVSPHYDKYNVKKITALYRKLSSPEDAVYIYYGAIPAMQFHQLIPEHSILGMRMSSPSEYWADVTSRLPPATRKVWLFFSHVKEPDLVMILDLAEHGWDVEPVFVYEGGAHFHSLFTAERRDK